MKTYIKPLIILTLAIAAAAITMQPARPSLSLGNIRTDRATFYAGLSSPQNLRYVERVPAMTGESKAFTANLRALAATL